MTFMTSGPTEPLFIDINKLAQQRGNSLVNQGQRLFQSFGQGATQLAQTLFPKQERYVGVSDPKNQMTRAVSIPNIDPTGMVGLTEKVGAKAAEPVFKGFKDISTKLLKDLEGKGTVAKQYVLDATNRPELKQPEKELFRRLLNDEGDKIKVSDFANRVKSELLPLNKGAVEYPRYESINLPEDLRGPVAGYTERVYQSPISSSAGDVHFSNVGVKTDKGVGSPRNYFAHTRIEDLPEVTPGKQFRTADGELVESVGSVRNFKSVPGGKRGASALTVKFSDGSVSSLDIKTLTPVEGTKTRRVIEIQSDLHQKGRLEQEIDSTRLKVLDKLRDGHFERMQKELGVTVRDIDEYVRKCL